MECKPLLLVDVISEKRVKCDASEYSTGKESRCNLFSSLLPEKPHHVIAHQKHRVDEELTRGTAEGYKNKNNLIFTASFMLNVKSKIV